MNWAVYERLGSVSQAGGVTTYREVARLADLDLSNAADRAAFASLLREISTYEHRQGRPLLSAVVVLRGRRMPGKGFFDLARALGVHTGDDDAAFLASELARVHAHWRGALSTTSAQAGS